MNAWYAAALSREVGHALFHRKILDTSVLIYRKEDGTPVALHDRCPHRFAPLHLGKRQGDEVICIYHALRFDGTGRCTHNAHGNGRIPGTPRVRTFPLEERYGFLWIWMGEGPAKPELLPDFGELDRGHPHGLAHTYMHMKANYELSIDNVMDLSHIDHVHGEIITMKIQAMHTAFETEDGPIIQAVHEEMGTTDFFSLNPVLMSNDVAPVKVRRLLKRLIAHDSRI